MAEIARQVRLPSGLPQIRAAYWDALQTGELIKPDRHRTLSAIAAACARAGYTHAQFVELINYAESGRALFRDAKTIAKHYRDAVRLVQSTPLGRDKTANRQELSMIRSAMGKWTGRNAIRDRRALDAIHARADELGLLVLAVPVRDLAVWAGMTFHRAHSALASLTDAGWLQRAAAATKTEAARYRVVLGRYAEVETDPSGPDGVTPLVSKRISSVPGPGPTGLVIRNDTPTALHDVWQGQTAALTDRDHYLYSHLGQIPASVAHLVEVTGMNRRTLYRRLKSLIESGLAAKSGDGYVRVEVDDFDALLPALGAEPVLERRAELYRAQQRAWSERFPAPPPVPGLRSVK